LWMQTYTDVWTAMPDLQVDETYFVGLYGAAGDAEAHGAGRQLGLFERDAHGDDLVIAPTRGWRVRGVQGTDSMTSSTVFRRRPVRAS
jgi:hypothetical protein